MLLRAVLAWVLVLHSVLPPSAIAADKPALPAPTPQSHLQPGIPEIPNSLETETADAAALSQTCPAVVLRKVTSTENRVARATRAAEAAVAQSIEAIGKITLELEEAKACGATVKCAVLRLQRAANEVRAVALPTLIGYQSETLGLVTDQLNKWIFRIQASETADDAKQTFREGFMAFLKGIGKEFKQNFSAVKSEELRNDPVVLFDFLKRLTIVLSFQGIAMGIASWSNADDPSYSTPWEIFLNTAVMMWLQSEVSARNTPRGAKAVAEAAPGVKTTALLPPAQDRFELYGRIPAAIAGQSGLVNETARRFLGFATLWPFEALMLFGMKTVMSAILTSGSSLLDPAVWTANGLQAAAFVSLFGLYLSAKESVATKIIELRALPDIQRMNSAPFQARWDALAQQHGIPYEGPNAWRGWMVRQLAQVFVPDPTPETVPTALDQEQRVGGWRELLKHLFSGSVWEKFQRHLTDRRRFRAFWNLDAVAELRASPEASRAGWSKFLEFALYRVPMTLFDSYVAVRLMGSEDAELGPEAETTP